MILTLFQLPLIRKLFLNWYVFPFQVYWERCIVAKSFHILLIDSIFICSCESILQSGIREASNCRNNKMTLKSQFKFWLNGNTIFRSKVAQKLHYRMKKHFHGCHSIETIRNWDEKLQYLRRNKHLSSFVKDRKKNWKLCSHL